MYNRIFRQPVFYIALYFVNLIRINYSIMKSKAYRIYVGSFILIFTLVLSSAIILGLGYYLTPMVERFYHPMHKLLKPSGLIGHGYGIVGSLFVIVGVAVYEIRKRIKLFMRFGALKHWLELHIFLCTLGPLLILFHTAFKFGGIISIGFWSMTAVVISGIIGRFIYLQIPRSIQGKELTIEDMETLDYEITNKLRKVYGVDEKIIATIHGYSYNQKSSNKISHSLLIILSSFFTNQKFISGIKKSLKHYKISKTAMKDVVSTIKSKLVLQRRIKILLSMQRLFKYWHVAHLPFAIIMFLILLIHVGVAVVFGYNWIF